MRWLLFAVTVIAAGCSTTFHYKQLDAGAYSQLPRRYELSDTPFHPQEMHHCGPAALATLLNQAGIDVTPQTLAKQVYLPARKGSLAPELLAAPRHYGHLAYKLNPELAHLLLEVSHGHPVLVLQNLGFRWIPRWHYAVVIGFDLEEGYIILRSGRFQRVVTALSTFERTWRRGDYWAFIVLKPGQLPAAPHDLAYLHAIVGLERTEQWLPANTSYKTAVAKWPENLTAWMGLGNTYYALGKTQDAEQAYRHALYLNPNYAPAHNNLAQTLADQRRPEEAEIHARKAVELGGAHQATYRQTLDAVSKNPINRE